MTRSDLIEQLAECKNISFAKAEAVIHEIFRSMTDTLLAGNRIEIRGFGSFEIRSYDTHSGRNPMSGEIITVKAKKLPFFKTGKELKERISAGGK
jgi:integration host factor subunit beta